MHTRKQQSSSSCDEFEQRFSHSSKDNSNIENSGKSQQREVFSKIIKI